MHDLPTYTLLVFGSLLAVLNPLATIPPFLAMTESNTVEDRRSMAYRACVVAAVILLFLSLTGLTLLNFFGVSLPAFQIAGGLVLIRAAFDLIQGSARFKVTQEERDEGKSKDDISITPLAIPILCGPATITAGILAASQADTWIHTGVLIGAIGLIYGGTFAMLHFAIDHFYRLGQTPIRVTSRLMGLILVAVSVQFVIDGVHGAFD